MSDRRSVYIAIPAYDSRVDVSTLLSLMTTASEFANRRWTMGVEFVTGNPVVHVARNILTAKFLTTPCTDLFFIDSDVGCSGQAIMRLLDHDADVVTGLYRARTAVEQYMVRPYEGSLDRDPKTGLMRIEGAGMGFTRIRRHVIERMVEHFEATKPDSWHVDTGNPELKLWPWFEFGQIGHQILGEDVYFYKQWAELGGKVWADPDVELHHTGMVRVSGVFSQFYDRFKEAAEKAAQAPGILGQENDPMRRAAQFIENEEKAA